MIYMIPHRPNLDCRTDLNALSSSLFSDSTVPSWLTSKKLLRAWTALLLLPRTKRQLQCLGIGLRTKNDERSASESIMTEHEIPEVRSENRIDASIYRLDLIIMPLLFLGFFCLRKFRTFPE